MMIKRISSVFISCFFVLASFFAVSCLNEEQKSENKGTLNELSLDKNVLELLPSEHYDFVCSLNPPDAVLDDGLVWSSSDSSVASVDSKGRVVANSAGTADISVSAMGKNAVCTVHVVSSAENVMILKIKSVPDLKVRETGILEVEVEPPETTEKVIFTSSNPDIVSVGSDGTLVAIRSGTAIISVRCGDLERKVAVDTSAGNSSEIVTKSENIFTGYITGIKVGESRVVPATILPLTSTENIECISNNLKVITVSSGRILTAKALGSAEVIVKCGDVQKRILVYGTSGEIASSDFDFVRKTPMMLDEYRQLDILTIPEISTDKATYTSSDPSVVEVSENGLMHSKKYGNATVSVTLIPSSSVLPNARAAGSGITKTLDVVVTAHDVAENWSFDSEKHWKTCSCGEKHEEASHEWNEGEVIKPATATEDGEKVYACTVCGKTKTEIVEKTGSEGSGTGGTDPENPDSGEPEPDNPGSEDHIHNYSDDWQTNETMHWHSCTICGAYNGEELHNFAGSWSTNEEGHWKYCSVCNERQKTSSHMEDEGTVIKEPSTIETGEKIYKCKVCEKTLRTQLIERLTPDHVHSGETWENDGTYHWKVCTKEDCPLEDKIFNRTTHLPDGGWKKDGDCHWNVCIECGEKYEETLHTSSDGRWFTDELTPEKRSGTHYHLCQVCGEKYKNVSHNWNISSYTPENPLPGEIVTVVWKCTCGATATEQYPFVPIVPVEPEDPICTHESTEWKISDTNHWHICNKCGEKYNDWRHDSDTDSHDNPIWKFDDTPGNETHYLICNTCGEKYLHRQHVSDTGTVTKYATDTEPGEKVYKCTDCGKVLRIVEIDIPLINYNSR